MRVQDMHCVRINIPPCMRFTQHVQYMYLHKMRLIPKTAGDMVISTRVIEQAIKSLSLFDHRQSSIKKCAKSWKPNKSL